MKRGRRRNRNLIIAWAYCDRFLLPCPVMFVPVGPVPLYESGKLFALTFGGALVLFTLYLLMGYLLRRTHYFCSMQDAYHLFMTPEDVDWGLFPLRSSPIPSSKRGCRPRLLASQTLLSATPAAAVLRTRNL